MRLTPAAAEREGKGRAHRPDVALTAIRIREGDEEIKVRRNEFAAIIFDTSIAISYRIRQ